MRPRPRSFPSYSIKGEEALAVLLVGTLSATSLLAGLREVELGLPDEALVLGVGAADPGRRVRVGSVLDHVDGDDLQVRVAVLVEAVVADHALVARDLRHGVANLGAGRLVAVVRLDRVADGQHDDVGRVISLHRVAAEVVGSGEGLAEVVDRLLGTRHLGGVGARGGRVDARLVALSLVDAVGGLDTVTAAERSVPSDVLHLLAWNADVLVVSAADVDGLSAAVLEGKQDRLEVAGLLLLVLGVLGHRAA